MTSMADKLKELLERAQAWPEEAQEELVHAGMEIEEEYAQSRPQSEDRRLAARERTWSRLERLFARLRALNPQTGARSTDEIRREEEAIAEDIRMMRRERHA